MNVNLFITLPLITTLVIMLVPPDSKKSIKYISLTSVSLLLAYSLYFLVEYYKATLIFDQGNQYFNIIFQCRKSWFHSLGINYFVGVDGISVLMILMTSVIIFTGVLSSWDLEHRVKEFFALLFALVAGVYGVFISFDLIFFFIFYELAVLPMYLLIGVWGTGNKEYSALKLTIMLLISSAFILTGFLAIYNESPVKTFDLILLSQKEFSYNFQNCIYPILFLGFGVLGALYPFHTWSPDGHASAPTSVSMLHAGVLMKLGGYGIIRIGIYLLPHGAQTWSLFFMCLSTINIIYGSLGALSQTDLKYLTAYSSVSHCGFVLFGVSCLNLIGLKGAVLQMFSHGIMTGLFFALIGFVYKRTKTRIIYKMEGLGSVLPVISVYFFIGGFASLGLPGLSGFIAETHMFLGGFLGNPWFNQGTMQLLSVIAAISIVVTAVYVLRSLCQIFMGNIVNRNFLKLKDAKLYEKISLLILSVCLFIVGILPIYFINLTESSITPVVNRLYL